MLYRRAGRTGPPEQGDCSRNPGHSAGRQFSPAICIPEGPSTHHLRTLVPNTIPLLVFGTRVLKYWVLGPSGYLMTDSLACSLAAALAESTSSCSRCARVPRRINRKCSACGV